MNYASLQLYNPYYAVFDDISGRKPPVMTDKIWDFLEPDYAFTHMNYGNPVVAGNGIQHWLSREGNKALGAEIYFQPNFYDSLGVGWTYDSVSDTYTFTGSSAANVERTTMPPLSINKLYKFDWSRTIGVGAAGGNFVAANYVGATTVPPSSLFQPVSQGGERARFNGYDSVGGNNVSFKINSIKPVDSILAYQNTSTSRPIARVDSRGVMYSEWDLTDDSLTAYFDSAVTDGEIMIATSRGIWFEKFSTPTNQMTFGPASFTGGTTNLFNFLKDPTTNKLHLYARRVMEGRPYTAEEKAWLVYLYSAVCRKGLITLGEELKHLFTPAPSANGTVEYDDINDIWHITRGDAGTMVGGSARYPAPDGVYLRDVQLLSGDSIVVRINSALTAPPIISSDSSTWKGVAIHQSGDLRVNHAASNLESTFRINSFKKVIFP